MKNIYPIYKPSGGEGDCGHPLKSLPWPQLWQLIIYDGTTNKIIKKNTN